MRPIGGIVGMLTAAILAAVPAHALDPDRSIAQYKHTRWSIDDGAPAPLSALAQGLDGYLWVGGLNGLYRFDGLRFEPIPERRPSHLGATISSILVSKRGEVWVGYATGGTAIYRNGALDDVPMPGSDYVMKLIETPDHSIWAILGRKEHQLFRFKDGHWTDVGGRFGFPSGDCRA